MTCSETQTNSPTATGPEPKTPCLRQALETRLGAWLWMSGSRKHAGVTATPSQHRATPGRDMAWAEAGAGVSESLLAPLPLTRVCLSVGDDRARTLSLGHTLSRRSCSIWEGEEHSHCRAWGQARLSRGGGGGWDGGGWRSGQNPGRS